MRRPILAAALLAAALPVVAAPLHAQGAASLPPGTRVRLDAPGAQGAFELVAATPDTLVVRRDDGAGERRVALADLQRLEVSVGRRSAGAGAGRGFLIGAGVGAAIGVASGFASGDDPPGYFSFTAEGKAIGGGILAGLGGGVIGVVVGATVRGERWERVDTAPRLTLTTPPAGRGIGLRLAGAF